QGASRRKSKPSNSNSASVASRRTQTIAGSVIVRGAGGHRPICPDKLEQPAGESFFGRGTRPKPNLRIYASSVIRIGLRRRSSSQSSLRKRRCEMAFIAAQHQRELQSVCFAAGRAIF